MARLLIADNSPFYRRLLQDALEERGHTVRSVADGREALDAVAAERPDAIILDLVMPRMSGASACRRLKASPDTRSIPIVILSGLREDEIEDRDGLGADAYVAKMQAGEMIAHLATTVDELLAGRLSSRLRGFDGMYRREVVSELLEEKRARDAILGSLNEGVLRVDSQGRIVETNAAARRLLRLEEPDLASRSAATVFGCDADALATALRDARGGEGRFRFRVGETALLARCRTDPEGRTDDLIIFLSDITSEDRADHERLEMQDQVRQAEKLSALGEIVAGVAHELNNPLTGILGYADLLLQISGDERTRDRLGKLRAQALRCRRLVENLLCFARKRQTYLRPHDINAVVRKAVAGARETMDETGAQVEVELAAALRPARLDFPQIEQAVGNLLSNAMQALVQRPGPDRRLVVRTAGDEEHVVVEVSDNGPGVPASVRGRLFEPFVTSRRHEGGTGLGLAVSAAIAAEHGGTLTYHDERPGSRFRLELPTARPAPADEAAPVAGGASRRPRALIVDDEPVVLDLIEDVLSEAGFDVRRAGNGAQALERIEDSAFDAILIDIKMPDMDGRHLYEAIRERRPEAAGHVAFTTGDPDKPGLTRFLTDTGCILLRKPFQLEAVAATCLDLVQAPGNRARSE
jgi:signal transduction histidine kinase/CheY-like chemotaxis protein